MVVAALIKNVCVVVALLALSGCAGWSSWESNKHGHASAATARALKAGEYRVVRGDTLYSIAFRNQLDYRQLARWNSVGNDYLIYPGQILRLNKSPSARVPLERHNTGEISSVAMNDVDIGRPLSITQDSPPPPPMGAREEPAQTAVGGYRWLWPTTGPIFRRFDQDSSRGIDFTGNEGLAVLAAAPGRVVYSGNALKGYGELIIIKHDELYLSAYGYNSVRHVQEGDVVTAGQPIAAMGRGPENRPTLHFEIRRSGRPVDPAPLLPARVAAPG